MLLIIILSVSLFSTVTAFFVGWYSCKIKYQRQIIALEVINKKQKQSKPKKPRQKKPQQSMALKKALDAATR